MVTAFGGDETEIGGPEADLRDGGVSSGVPPGKVHCVSWRADV